MTIKRSYRHLFMGAVSVGLLLANCTVKENDDDSCEKGDKTNGCSCPGRVEGHQVCGADGVFGSCICPPDGASGNGNASGSSSGGGDADEGGAPGGGSGGSSGSSNGGASEGGAPTQGGAGGGADAGGAGGEAPAAIDCNDCLQDLCGPEWDACIGADDDLCYMQYLAVSECIEEDRDAGINVTRDRLRGCGVTFGNSSSPNQGDWAPTGMTAEATDLINCMATSSSQIPPDGEWANLEGDNFPSTGPKPWPADSCAKLACTSPR